MYTLRTWFGVFSLDGDDLDRFELFPREEIVHRLILDRFTEGTQPRNKNREGVKETRRVNLADLAIESGFVESENEYFEALHDVSIKVAKHKIREAITSASDKRIIQAVNALDEIDNAKNLLSEREREWSSLSSDVPSEFSSSISSLYDSRKIIQDYITEEMEKVAPNLSHLAGHLLGARIISLAGGIDKLAKMPSSSAQVLGASKALFRHLRSGNPPPKHGIIFQHPMIRFANREQRGKIARAFASKLVIAARVDYYSGELHEEITNGLKRRVEEIRNKA
jgi:nucleolar protein 56